jgi:hypothetical protein
MPYLAIENFKGGLDKRRMELTSEVGSLQTLKNAHINRGGEIEKALAFVESHTLPAGTFGFAVVRQQLYVFGSAAAPVGLPVDVTYQRLQNPDGATMTAVAAIDVFGGKLYVIADFNDNTRHHFYDGSIVSDWYTGVVRSSMTNNDGIAEHLRALIDASPNYSATRVGSVVTITGGTSSAFDITANARNGDGNTFNNQTAVVATTQSAVAGVVEVLSAGSFRITGGTEVPGTNRVTSVTVDGIDILGGPAEVLASGSFSVTGGTSNPGVNTISAVLVNGVDILGAAVNHTGNNSTTATAIRAQINSYSSSPDYTASGSGAQVIITAVASSGAAPNGFVINPTENGDVTTGSISNMSGGSYSGVQWATSNSATATAVANRINTYTSSTEYTASASGDRVTVTALAGTGATPNGRVVAVVDEGDVTVSDITNMASGVNAGSGQPQISTVTIGGTFEPGDLFSVSLASKVFGADRVAGLYAETTLKIHKNKVYSAHEATLLFSGVAEPTKWKSEDTGSGAIDMSSQASGFEDITAVSVYQNNLAIFARNVTQIWFVDPDPDSNQQLQVLENTGTRSPGSVIGFGDSDVFFLADTGIRSLRARDSSNAAAVSDVGTPIDPLIVSVLASLTEAQIVGAKAVIEPKDGRYILSLGTIMYVFSYFASSKVSSWSTYERNLQVDWFAKSGTKIYARAGDKIYLLGGSGGTTHDNSPVVVELPYIDGNKLANWKHWTGVDMAVEGTWLVEYNSDPNQPTVWETIATIDKHTIGELNNAVQAFAPVFKLRFTNTTTTAAKIGTILVHYKDTKQT